MPRVRIYQNSSQITSHPATVANEEHDLCSPCYQYLSARPLLRAVLTGQANSSGNGWAFLPLPDEQQPAYGRAHDEARCALCGCHLSADDASLVLLMPSNTDDWHSLPYRERTTRGEAIAAFAFKGDFDHYSMLVRRLSVPEELMNALLQHYTRQEEGADLAGADMSPIADFVAACEKILPSARFMRDHKHDWNEDGYCRHCNRDGRA